MSALADAISESKLGLVKNRLMLTSLMKNKGSRSKKKAFLWLGVNTEAAEQLHGKTREMEWGDQVTNIL